MACGGTASKADAGVVADSGSTSDAGTSDGGTGDGGSAPDGGEDVVCTPDGGVYRDGGRALACVALLQSPALLTNSDSATFDFTCAVPECTYQCALDSAPLAGCTPPVSFTGLSVTTHHFDVVATDGSWSRSLSYDWRIDQTPPALVSAAYGALGEIQLTFDELLDENATLQIGRYGISPVLISPLSVRRVDVGYDAQGNSRVTLRLSRYPLPRDYTLSVDARDLAGNEHTGITRVLPGATTGARLAFVSQATGTGDLLNWSAVPLGAHPATGLEAADDVCQAEADAAGFQGTFRAYLSDTQDDAACRIRGLSGKLSDDCGLGTAPLPDAGPWIGLEGLPVARTAEALAAGKGLSPIAYHADGTSADRSVLLWSSTDASGRVSGKTCTDWTGADSAVVSVTTAGPGRIARSKSSTETCSTHGLGLLCLQTDRDGAPLNDFYKESGRLVFVTSDVSTGDLQLGGLSGLAAADERCRQAAARAGLLSASYFVAWLSTSTTDAYCHVLGGSGKRADACGLSASPATGPWVTTTGFPVADDLDDLVDNGPRYPIFATEDGGTPPGRIWTGTTAEGVFGAPNCGNWQSQSYSQMGTWGGSSDALSWTNTGSPNDCSYQESLLCIDP